MSAPASISRRIHFGSSLAPAEPEREVVNLMEALRRSVAQAEANGAVPKRRKKPLADGRARRSASRTKG